MARGLSTVHERRSGVSLGLDSVWGSGLLVCPVQVVVSLVVLLSCPPTMGVLLCRPVRRLSVSHETLYDREVLHTHLIEYPLSLLVFSSSREVQAGVEDLLLPRYSVTTALTVPPKW